MDHSSDDVAFYITTNDYGIHLASNPTLRYHIFKTTIRMANDTSTIAPSSNNSSRISS